MHTHTLEKRRQKEQLYELFAQVATAMANPHRLELIDLLVLAPRTVEELANLRGYPTLAWGGLSPDNSPLLLRNVGRAKIYAIELDAR